jgi:chromosome segregation ATPase
MSSKLEKAQLEYEAMLRDLGEKARMVNMLDKASPEALQGLERARESLSDRKTELDFIESEIARQEAALAESKQKLEADIAATREALSKTEKSLDAKKGKLEPLKKKLTGAEYDIKFVQKSLDEEQRKLKIAEEKEDPKRVKEHQEIIARIKIDYMRRQKEIADLKRQIMEISNPTKSLGGSLEELEQKLDALEEELEAFDESEDAQILEDLRKQRADKEKEVRIGEAAVLDAMADLGENLYDRRVSHPVLNKYYADLDVLARAIDEMQKK